MERVKAGGKRSYQVARYRREMGQVMCEAQGGSLEILKGLVGIDTTNPPGREREAALWLEGLLEGHGFLCEVQDLGDGRANLVAVAEGRAQGPELLLNGHLDVVPAMGQWSAPPFKAVVRDGKVYDRGSCDMKGGVAAMCQAAIRVMEKGGPGKGRLKLVFVADEECSNLGLRAYLREMEEGDFAIIGEPTGMEVAVAHRGVSRDYIDIYGEAHHAALPDTKQNSSILKTAQAIVAIQTMNQELEGWRHEILPPPGIAVTRLEAYEKDNVVPGKVRMLTDFRLLPGMEKEEVSRFLRQGFSRAGLDKVQITSHFYMPGGEIPVSDSYVARMLKVRGEISGSLHRPQAFDASCEQCFLANAGIKTIICGPGNLAQAHTVDEYVEISQLETAVMFYERAIREILG